MKDNSIKGVSIMNKPEILKLLIERGLVPSEALAKLQKVVKEIDPNTSSLNQSAITQGR